jgi:hypothetical protein
VSGVSIALFAAVACVAIVGFWVLIKESRRGRGAGLFLLSALPLALLFLIAPVPLVALQLIQVFQTIAAAGRSDANATGVLALGIARPLWPGLVGCLLALCVAAVLQVRATRSGTPPVRGILSVDDAPDAGAAPSSENRSWGNWILAASALLAIPAGILHYLTSGIAPLIVEAGRVLTAPSPSASTVAGMTLGQLSALLSARLLLAAVGGLALTFFVLVFAIFNLAAVRYTRPSDALEKFSWAVFAILGIAAMWNLVAMTIGMRSF